MREYTDANGIEHKGVDAAFACLLDILFNERTPPRERIAAFREWCDRGFGKAKQKVELTGDGAKSPTESKDPKDMTNEELDEALDAIRTLKRLGAVSADDVSEH